MKRQHTEWEKTFANAMTDKGLISNIYKRLTTQHQKNKQAGTFLAVLWLRLHASTAGGMCSISG